MGVGLRGGFLEEVMTYLCCESPTATSQAQLAGKGVLRERGRQTLSRAVAWLRDD